LESDRATLLLLAAIGANKQQEQGENNVDRSKNQAKRIENAMVSLKAELKSILRTNPSSPDFRKKGAQLGWCSRELEVLRHSLKIQRRELGI